MRLFLLLVVTVSLAASGAFAAEPASRAEGQKLAKRDCGACHATGKRDRSKVAPAPPFRVLGERYDVEGLAEALAEGISVGHPKMPEFSYPPDQIDDFIAYLKSFQPVRPRVKDPQ